MALPETKRRKERKTAMAELITLQEAIEILISVENFLELAIAADDSAAIKDFTCAYLDCKNGIRRLYKLTEKEVTDVKYSVKWGLEC